ncbi:alpha-1,3-glucan synthase [Microthyrium microscopicum]|uniref:alpha-1,3-glucan synthase n=1 Tax=Microthyrium microscopicum TaxID=703497 RepID=A0A6A6U8N9_9PEZI|nr:alpha-1,3-glucan synthase [Microthyrium microscopicum]
MRLIHFFLIVSTNLRHSLAAPYIPDEVNYNLNQNQNAQNPLEYAGKWDNHTFYQSPGNWRFPFYTFFLDRFVNGDPSNDDANSTQFEHDVLSNQMRHGGDVLGLMDSLDYLQGMGIKGLYVAGSPFLNQPWTADSYSPVDLTILDHHFGTIDDWRAAVTEIHKRGMYIILDNTFATMADLVGFEGYLNTTTPFSLKEHPTEWKSARQYLDFKTSNDYNQTCTYPRFWNETGYPIDKSYTDQMVGCYNSEFDQYGDTEAFGVFPDFQRQITKFASVQDRLREWEPSVREKLQHFSCLAITMLDIDGFRFDKATQATVDAHADFAAYVRECARSVGKSNFFMPGEITGGNTFGSVYLGRGRQPNMVPSNISFASTMSNSSDSKYYIRDLGKNSLDAAAFHYTVYRSLTRFLGMDGNLEAGYDANGGSWTDAWNTMLLTNDFVNANTGLFDPRHMYGVTNQDVFRWPAIRNGTQRFLLGMFVTAIHMPGVPMLTWGEEQAFYVLDSTASNYLYGRQPMSSSSAWQVHGCYALGSTQYYQMPWEDARHGCLDDNVSLDHRDSSHPVRNIIKHMHYLRLQFPVLNDGWYLQDLSKQTEMRQYPGSGTVKTETGLWSVLRGELTVAQNLQVAGAAGNQSVWLVYHNDNDTITYQFDCTDKNKALVSAFASGTTVKNLFYPHEELTLVDSPVTVTAIDSKSKNGCLNQLKMTGYEYKAYVPKDQWVGPPPMITRFLPGHDARILSKVAPGQQESVNIEVHFSTAMDCDKVTAALEILSTTEDLRAAQLVQGSVTCANASDTTPAFVGGIPTAWSWKATLDNVSNGVHSITIRNATTTSGAATNSVDRFYFRIGQPDNPIVFEKLANYTRALIHQDTNGTLLISHKAAGADKWRYTLNWGSSWSDWASYHGGNDTLQLQPWTGTKKQQWDGTHIIAQYWGQQAGSSSAVQHADLARLTDPPRRFPHIFAHGPFNQYGFDAGLRNSFEIDGGSNWNFHFMSEWPDMFQLNVWGINPDGQPDQTRVYGDVDGDGVLDRLPPSSLSSLAVNFTEPPPSPYLAYRLMVNEGTLGYTLVPVGSRWVQLALFWLLATLPLVTGGLAVYLYMRGFYSVKFNEVGISEKFSLGQFLMRKRRGNEKIRETDDEDNLTSLGGIRASTGMPVAFSEKRRTVLIATMEYDIEDWAIKIKIGGLGVMAQLMGKNLQHQDLIWVVPCVGGVEYPTDTAAEPMDVMILGNKYEVQVQYHFLRNITYVLLDAPIFRGQTKTEPYPPRMDDLDSAIYYSAWNQCIAKTIDRFPIDLYHINDYHGAAAPLYLLPRTIPCCLSLHNAEFQGLWPIRTPKEREEVCHVFNLPEQVVEQYVQFGSVFNLLHAGASYLRVHQKGVGAVGVSNKYGKRSWARYPIFWGLTKIGKLPNPDPTDTDAWDKQLPKEGDIHIDPAFEAGRTELKRQAQEWAGLDQRADAELFVFVGRWSVQKGVDLIADVFPAVLEQHPKVQVIAIGPVIDLYGKFAALKLEKIMEKYPGRVYSKPEFTALPPYIFSGAEFALIPSRDEPFGLVAVEFGRKGALGVGARVGGLGQMPGWWYTVESTTSSHLLKQFKEAIDSALASKQDVRAMMRARSAKQRFPVQQWKEDLGILQSKSIKIHQTEANKPKDAFHRMSRHFSSSTIGNSVAAADLDAPPVPDLPTIVFPGSRSSSNGSGAETPPFSLSQPVSGSNSPLMGAHKPSQGSGLRRQLSLGMRNGPGHAPNRLDNGQGLRQVSDSTLAEEDEEDDIRYGEEQLITEEELQRRYQAQRDLHQQTHAFSPKPSFSPTPAYSPQFSNRRYGNRESLASLAPSLAPSMAPSMAPSAMSVDSFNPQTFEPPTPFYAQNSSNRSSALSLDLVVGEKKDYNLQKVDPFFTDSTGEFYNTFEHRLEALNGKNSESSEMCIEEFLIKSEKSWFDKFRDARLGRSIIPGKEPVLTMGYSPDDSRAESRMSNEYNDEFLLGSDYKPPTGLKMYMQMKLGDWPIYTLLLAFGQIIAANSYQVTLLTGSVGQAADKLYTIASIYLGASIIWWILFRRVKAVYCLSSPFLLYGLAFFLLGLVPYVGSGQGRYWTQNVATGLYAIASSSGALFFSLNFGDEGGAPVKDWIFRACVIQGTQQLYVAALWYWGSLLSSQTPTGAQTSAYTDFASSPKITAVTVPIALLLWGVGIVIQLGLPTFYRQAPGKVPSFYAALTRRKIVVWTMVTVIVQNFFLSAPYGRNWQFLWSSRAAPVWSIFLLIILFFVVIWMMFLFVFARLSAEHSWILPLFAIGLGAPRWCQMLWGTSSIGLYLPWAGGAVSSALTSRSLWLWLGLLDTIQGVGFGMIFLQTLTRIHVAFTLLAAQVLGSVSTILARAIAPNNLGPGDVFPDFSAGADFVLSKAWFWVALGFQVLVCLGFLKFFRSEQLNKP